MRSIIKILFILFMVSRCAQEPKQEFNMNTEPLSASAEAKTGSWVGYKTFSFGLQDVVDNFSKPYAVANAGKLVSASQSVLYSMPNDLRRDVMNEKASKLVKQAQVLANAIQDKSEETIKEDLQKLIKAYTVLNEEINYVVNN